MPVVHIGTVRTQTVRGWPVVAATIDADGRSFDIWYRASRGPLTARADAFLVAALLPAMKLGADIHVEQPVARHLLRHVDHIQSLACVWWDGYQRVKVQATPREITAIDPQRGVGCFFSGGVDSFHTVLTRSAEISDLIFVHGLDIPLEDTARRLQTAHAIKQAAHELGKPLVEVETNVRALLDPYTDWARHSDGAAMASIAHVLSAQLQLFLLSAGYAYSRKATVYGTNPLLLQLWATPEIEIDKAGRDFTRTQKIVYLADNEIAMRWLRVCWEHLNTDYNCGQCSKCMGTMLPLQIIGALDRCRTFMRPLDLNLLRSVPPGPSDRRHYQEVLAFAEKQHADEAIIEILRRHVEMAPMAATSPGYGIELERCQRQVFTLQRKLAGLRSSRSMRVTAPLRAAGRAFRTLKEHVVCKPWKPRIGGG